MNQDPGKSNLDPNIAQPSSISDDPIEVETSPDQNRPSSLDNSTSNSEQHPQDPGCDANVPVYKPYAIEEPEDDQPASPTSLPALTYVEDQPETWQTDLVDSMEDLHCYSDSDPRILPILKRGKKRKSSTVVTGMPQSGPSRTTIDKQYDASTLSPKRLRQRNERSRENLKGLQTDPMPYSKLKKPRSSGSSSSQSSMTDTSGAPTADKSTTEETMDID